MLAEYDSAVAYALKAWLPALPLEHQMAECMLAVWIAHAVWIAGFAGGAVCSVRE